jgi:hypothetical protein
MDYLREHKREEEHRDSREHESKDALDESIERERALLSSNLRCSIRKTRRCCKKMKH